MSDKNSATRRGSRSPLLMLMFLIALAGCACSGYLFWTINSTPNKDDIESNIAQSAPVLNVDPLYVSMDTFTVSLKPTENESDRVLYIGLAVRLADSQSSITLDKYLPEYRSRLFMLLTQQTYETLSTDEGKNNLINNIQNELKKPLAFKQSINATDILINEFILR
ncbi:flagellar basal body-associated FliL family protein [Citrobacter sp. wls619]|uniref:flagellar basal body-associated FliL family protein n=1 Tax=Citrobacter sp. wls619 TaxID=2576432 RepID=UPI0014854834|nr:flagellar basal body-associated FliL family protein [Citrobacter sp. wls619]